MLYLVATPIGNLADLSFRAVETLKNCNYILCEDTRHSRILLNHYNIVKPLKSLHKFNETVKTAQILADLNQGATIALVTDAGSPGISDPGTLLVQACVKEGIPVSPIPGPCAAIAALSCSGMDTNRFQFMGFLPRKAGELRQALQEILAYPGTTVVYESPNRLKSVLKCIEGLAPDRPLAIVRELTKKFEEVRRGTAPKLLQQAPPTYKGEIALIIAGNQNDVPQWEHLTPEEHVAFLEKAYGLSRQEAIRMTAEMRGVRKRDVYNLLHHR